MTSKLPATELFLSVIARLGLVRSEAYARAQLQDLFAGVDLQNKRVLDIGGGSGIYSFYAACAGAREVVCLEPEASGSKAGATLLFGKISAELPGANVRLDRRTVEEYTTDGFFDVILMHFSLNHLDENACIELCRNREAWESYKNRFAHIGSLLRPGGKIIVSDCARHNFFALLGAKNPLCPTIEWRKHQQPEVWARLLEETGFRRPAIRWEPLYRFGFLGRVLLGNKVAAYFLKGIFRLEVEKG